MKTLTVLLFALVSACAQTVRPPAYASAAGFDHLVFDDEMSARSVAPSPTSQGNYHWYTYNWQNPANSLPSEDVTFQNGYMTIKTDTSGYGYGVSTVGLGNTAQVWHHGYFEARIRTNPSGNTLPAPNQQWPSFWGFDVAGQQGLWTSGKPYGEIDFTELIPLWNGPVYMYTAVQQWQDGVPGAGSTPDFPSAAFGTDYSQWHVFGVLWTTNQVKTYLDGNLVNTVATGPGTQFTGIEESNISIILGTGPNWPVDVDYVRVWR